MSGLSAQLTAAVRWLDERFLAGVGFRLRLITMALRPIDRIPALVIIALESPGYEDGALLDPAARPESIGPVS